MREKPEFTVKLIKELKEICKKSTDVVAWYPYKFDTSTGGSFIAIRFSSVLVIGLEPLVQNITTIILELTVFYKFSREKGCFIADLWLNL
ncbi:MAG: hypothetical protein PHY47_00785 [Lachnospiraceae bacterium]|nr:hypothetical protein [Lachnospiraceae bacterium]